MFLRLLPHAKRFADIQTRIFNSPQPESHSVRVRLLLAWNWHLPGKILEVTPGVADTLVKRRAAVVLDESTLAAEELASKKASANALRRQ